MSWLEIVRQLIVVYDKGKQQVHTLDRLCIALYQKLVLVSRHDRNALDACKVYRLSTLG